MVGLATALRRLFGSKARGGIEADLAATYQRLTRDTRRTGVPTRRPPGDDWDLWDPHLNPGTDIVVDETHHGLDHGLGIANPDHFEPPSFPDDSFGS